MTGSRAGDTVEWTKGDGERYTLRTGTCEAVVWNAGQYGYGAMFKHAGTSTAQYGFDTLETAQAWCLAELAKLRAAGRCGERDKEGT